MLTVADLYKRPKNKLVLMTKTTTFKQLINDERPVVLGFYNSHSDTLGTSQPRQKISTAKFKEELRELSARYGDKVKVIRIDMPRNRDLCDALGLDNANTILLYVNELEEYRVAPKTKQDYKRVQKEVEDALKKWDLS